MVQNTPKFSYMYQNITKISVSNQVICFNFGYHTSPRKVKPLNYEYAFIRKSNCEEVRIALAFGSERTDLEAKFCIY